MIPPAGRIATLDALRGVAVMGILLMNVAAFAMPFAAYDNPAAYGPMHGADIAVWAVNLVLVDGKMRALFSALFGASMLLIADRAEAAGHGAARVHYARMSWLLVFGLAHACLVWQGDILVLYALVGLVAFPLRRLPVANLLVLAGVLFAAQAASLGLHYQGLAALADAARLPGAKPADIAVWGQVLDEIGRPAPSVLAADLALHRGPWGDLVDALVDQEAGAMPTGLLFTGPETLGLMLLGMAGLRSGLLTGAWRPRTCRRMAAACYLIGLPPMIGIALWLVQAGFPPLATSIAIDLVAMPSRWIVAAGHAALVAALLHGRPAPPRLVAVGRAAFTNYLGTSIAMTGLFYGWGLGLYGHVERWALYPIVFAWWLVMLGWSRPWLDRFAYGPLEWLWRSLARGRPAPFVRQNAVAS